MIFSPSLWVSPKIYHEKFRFTYFPLTKMYLYAGGKEGANMEHNAKRFKDVMEKHGRHQVHFHLEIDPAGQHNEARWGMEFPKAVEWLF